MIIPMDHNDNDHMLSFIHYFVWCLGNISTHVQKQPVFNEPSSHLASRQHFFQDSNISVYFGSGCDFAMGVFRGAVLPRIRLSKLYPLVD